MNGNAQTSRQVDLHRFLDRLTQKPVQSWIELEDGGEIGRSAAYHHSFVGYILKPKALLEESTSTLIQHMKRDGANAVALIRGCPICCRSVRLVQREIEPSEAREAA